MRTQLRFPTDILGASVLAVLLGFATLGMVLSSSRGDAPASKNQEVATLGDVPAPYDPPNPPVQTVYPTLSPPTATASEAEPLPTPADVYVEEIKRNDLGAWKYKVQRRIDGKIVGGVEYDRRSIGGLNAYAGANKALARQLAAGPSKAGRIEAYVTFRTYVPVDQFRSWVTSLGLHVRNLEIRFVDSNGLDAVIGLGGQPDDPLPQSALDEQIASLQDSTSMGLRELKGVYFAIVTVDRANLSRLADSPQVYIADVTSAAVRDELERANVPGAADAIITRFPPTPFWEMEHTFGLEKFQK